MDIEYQDSEDMQPETPKNFGTNKEFCCSGRTPLWYRLVVDCTAIITIAILFFFIFGMFIPDAIRAEKKRMDSTKENFKSDPWTGLEFVITGSECNDDSGACFQKGPLYYCNSSYECGTNARFLLNNYQLTWVVLSPTKS